MGLHALLSASGAERWLKCPPAPRLEEKEPERETIYTKEGTLAHLTAQRILEGKSPPPEATEEMIECALKYRDYIESLDYEAKTIETKIFFDDYVPDGFGTCDCILIGKNDLKIVDYKYGAGVKVEAERNPQLMLYALGVLQLFDIVREFKTVELCIYQPRMGGRSEWLTTPDELKAWGKWVARPIAEKAYAGEGRRNAGAHCRWCRYAPKCTTCQTWALLDMGTDIQEMTPEKIAEILDKAPIVRGWLQGVETYAAEIAKRGGSIPGYKAVEKRTRRQYTDPDGLIESLEKHGITDIFKPRELLGIPALEKKLGHDFGRLAGGFITKPRGELTLVPMSDPREEVLRFENLELERTS